MNFLLVARELLTKGSPLKYSKAYNQHVREGLLEMMPVAFAVGFWCFTVPVEVHGKALLFTLLE